MKSKWYVWNDWSVHIDTENLVVNATWRFGKRKARREAKSLKQAWWYWYNPQEWLRV